MTRYAQAVAADEALEELLRRGRIARAMGGISVHEVMCGAKVPEHWHFDALSYYFVPVDFADAEAA